MGSLYWDCEIIFKALFSAATAIVLLAFNAGVKGTTLGFDNTLFGFANSVWGYLALTVIIIISAAVSSKRTSKIFDVSFDVFKTVPDTIGMQTITSWNTFLTISQPRMFVCMLRKI